MDLQSLSLIECETPYELVISVAITPFSKHNFSKDIDYFIEITKILKKTYGLSEM